MAVRLRRARLVPVLLAILLVASACALVHPKRPHHHHPENLPIVFVHGQLGSAQQFESNAMRFTSNGYPQDLLFAFEYDTFQPTNPLDDLDQFVDAVLAETGAEQVYAIGHSRGTSLWTSYLDPTEGGIDGSEKVAKYVNIDGATMEGLPGGVPTIGIWGEWNTAGSGFNRRGDENAQIGPDPADNFYFGTKSHSEVATSAEAFGVMYRFFTGREPFTTRVIPEPPGRVTIAGRAVLVPQNEGFAGTTVEVWRVDPATGHRIGSSPEATFPIDESGDFGPVRVNGRKHYELAIVRADGGGHHFYFEPFSRSNHFVRLLTNRPGEGFAAFTQTGDASTNLVLTRMREFWGDQGAKSDIVTVDGLNVMRPDISPRTGVNLAVLTFDDELDGITGLEKGELSPFNLITFISAADLAVDASPTGEGTVSVEEFARGSATSTVVNVPNWPSATDFVTVQFRDDERDDRGFPHW